MTVLGAVAVVAVPLTPFPGHCLNLGVVAHPAVPQQQATQGILTHVRKMAAAALEGSGQGGAGSVLVETARQQQVEWGKLPPEIRLALSLKALCLSGNLVPRQAHGERRKPREGLPRPKLPP